jgi:WD40 repeat protein
MFCKQQIFFSGFTLIGLGLTVGKKTKIQVSPCGKYLASGSTSNYSLIWDLDPANNSSFNPPYKMKGHTKCVNLVGWSYVGGIFRVIF